MFQRATGGAVLRRRVDAGVGGGCGVSSGRRGAGTAGPSSDFFEVGEKLRTTFFELLAPSSNRLVSAYIPARTLAEISQGKALNGLEVYGLAEVPRQAEYTDCTPQVFQQLLKSVEPTMGNLDAEKIGRFAEEVNTRLQSLGNKPIEVGRPEMLGGVFEKTDAAGFAMLLALKQGDRNVTMASGVAMLRVKQRLLFAYLFRKYESPETVSLVRKDLESWADAILAGNR